MHGAPPDASTPSSGTVVLPARFKKHAGKTLAQIEAVDHGYIHWLRESHDKGTLKDPVLDAAIEDYTDWLKDSKRNPAVEEMLKQDNLPM